jgi:hypothetical protein
VAVGETSRGDGAYDGGNRALVTGLDRPVAHTVAIGHPLQARLAKGTQVEVVLQQQPQQLEAVGLDVLLQVEMLQAKGRLARQECGDLCELDSRSLKGILPEELVRLFCPAAQSLCFCRPRRVTRAASPALPSASTLALAARKRSVAACTCSTSAAGSIKNFVLPPSL